MGDEWIVGGIVVAVVVVVGAVVALMTRDLKLPANPYPLANPDQTFRAYQYVPDADAAMLTNHETITWTDAQGRQRQITVEREVK